MLRCTGKVCIPPSGHQQSPADLAKLIRNGHKKYGHLPPKTVITNPWECLCVDLIGPYTFKGKDNLQIDFMALTMINPTSSWVEIAELPVVKQLCQ